MGAGVLTRHIRLATGFAALAALVGLAVSGCRPDFDESSCSDDSECFQGEQCIDGTCRFVPSDEADGGDDAEDADDTSIDGGPDGDAGGPSVFRVEIESQLIELQNGASQTLSARAYDADGNELTGVSFQWSSADTAIASFETPGELTANDTGSTTVRAEAQGVRDTAAVRVTPIPVDSVRIGPQSASEVSTDGTPLQLFAMPVGPNGNDLCSESEAKGKEKPCGREVVWKSGSPSFATVSETGEVTGNQEGSVRIFAVIEGREASKQLSVTPDANNPPAISTGGDRSVVVNTQVDLDASATTDPDGHELTSFEWTFTNTPQGANPTLMNSMQPQASFTPTETGDYDLQITVEDEFGAQASETVKITVQSANQAPTADAGSKQVVNVSNTANLDATGSSDPDGDNLTYSWQFLRKPSNSQASLANATGETPSFTVDKGGRYRIELTVDDGRTTDTDRVTVRGNRPPTADAGPDITVTVGNRAQLSAASSSDPDGNSLNYSWSFNSQPGNTAPTLNGATTATPTFMVGEAGSYTLEVTVDDGNATATDTVTVTGNTAPTAYAGADQSVHVGTQVSVDGTGSFDPDSGDTLTYGWSFTSSPSGASPSLSTGGSPETGTFTPQETGTYELRLTVSDGNATTQDSVVITSTNNSPNASATSNSPVTQGDTVNLDASGSSDSDGDSLSYSWTVTGTPSGASTPSLTDPNTATPSWSTTTSTTTGDYTFEVTVTDDHGATDTATVTVTVNSN